MGLLFSLEAAAASLYAAENAPVRNLLNPSAMKTVTRQNSITTEFARLEAKRRRTDQYCGFDPWNTVLYC